ncbi:hypothetical protein C0Q70_11773 [Pomacea canaliculata]|uniref:CUB domain-containing protein n=1 Tax=Pomacea canaliculata TaxID=400727 RepID=A0A2T7P706_POMCA|nr:hypothetical protein C0Q70_11773 [Pomacea canaliculata]
MGVTAGGLATFGVTDLTQGKWGYTGSEVTDIWSYIKQTGPAAFRINTEACQGLLKAETIYASEGMVDVVFAENSTDTVTCTWNIVVPEGKFMTVVFDKYHSGDMPLCKKFDILLIIDYNQKTPIQYLCGVSGLLPPISYSLTNTLCFKVQYIVDRNALKSPLDIKFRFNTTDKNWRQNLHVVNMSLKSGYVTSPGFDGTMEYPNYLNSSTTITPPPGHTVMISFPRIDIEKQEYCSYDYLTLIKVDTGGETEIWKKCGAENIPPLVFNSSLRLVFVSDIMWVKTGFKMLFSFHPYLETPEEVDAGVFNCSVPYYHTFKDHVHCNMEKECQGGEDEVSCPYTNPSCGEGLIDGEKKCYRFENQTRNITWNKALTACHSYGQQLVTLKTEQEWRDFQRILDYGKRSAYLYVGLFSTHISDFDLMYGNVLQWIDGTMAHYIQVEEPDLYFDTSACFIMQFGYNVILSYVKCNKNYTVKLVCESPKNNASQKSQTFPTLPVVNEIETPDSIQNASFVKCLNKQISVDFLSCAKESNCDVDNYISFCEIPGKQQLPMFNCDNTQTIPYTLVCDYRSDCVDGSDERFCKFSVCEEFACNNQQCVHHSGL